jgi:hypothetical protein
MKQRIGLTTSPPRTAAVTNMNTATKNANVVVTCAAPDPGSTEGGVCCGDQLGVAGVGADTLK